MQKLLTFVKNNKIVIIILASLLPLIGLVVIIIRTNQEYTVREILLNGRNGEVFIVRSDGKEFQQEIKTHVYDHFIRDGDYLIHQRNDDSQDKESVVYLPDVEQGLLEQFRLEDKIHRFSDEDNYIYSTLENTFLVQGDKQVKLNHLCRDIIIFQETTLCIDIESNLLRGSSTDLVKVLDNDGDPIFALTLQTTYDKSTLYIASATRDEVPQNLIYVVDEISELSSPDTKYLLNDIPSLITAQESRTVLTSVKQSAGGELATQEFNLYTLDNGIQPIKGYRYTLKLIY